MDTTGFHNREGEVWCDDMRLTDLAERYGTPAYVYSKVAFLRRLQRLTEAFAAVDHLVCFSVKASSNLAILRFLAEAGAGADVVSGGELDRARRAGVAADRIVFAGVGKTAAEIRGALDAGILSINCESESELDLIARVARESGTIAPVTLRINPGVAAGGHGYIETGHDGTKFGVSVDEARVLLRRVAGADHLELVGVGAHIGSQILEPGPYERSLDVLRDLVLELRDANVQVRLLDMGGGLGIRYDDEEPRPLEEFAAVVASRVADLGVLLVLEPGRFIAGNSGVLLTRVVHVKRSPAKSFVILDAAMNDLLRPSLYGAHHRIDHAANGHRTPVQADLVGPICETGDFLARDALIPECRSGDLLVVWSAGAYGATMASNYNSRLKPPEVLVEGDRARLIRRRETVDDLLRTELEAEDGNV